MARAAVCFLVAALLAGVLEGCGGSESDSAAGERVFVDSGCGDCHTLGAADARGTVGPNLDRRRPDMKAVVRQVTNGGNGMPAFAGRLSSAEILEVASFVNRAAGGAGAINTKFEPNSKRIGDCSAEGPSCYEQSFGNLTYERGPKRALRRFASYMARDPKIERGCHRIAHAMGRAALVRLNSPGRALAEGSAVCWSGYYHGVIEGGFAGAARKDLVSRARRLCSDRSLRRDRFLLYQCVHGLGHGLMLITAYDLPRALGTCSRLATNWDQQSCVGGVFMENFSSFYRVRSRWLRSNDLLYPCSRVARQYKYYCYDQVTSRILRKVDWDWHRTARICRTAERDWVGVCFESFGRDVSSFARNDRQRALKLCGIAGRNMTDCVYAVARDIVNQDAGRYARARRFCDAAPRGLSPRCYTGIGTVVAVLEPRSVRREAACRRLSRRWAAACIAGTR